MKRHVWLQAVVYCSVGLLSAGSYAGARPPEKSEIKKGGQVGDRPNIVFIVADQWRKQSAGFWSEEPYRSTLHDKGDPVVTPNMDRLADEGVVLTQAISTFPLCSPYRGMMLSGKLPHRNGVILNCNDQRPASQLREDVTCVSDVLKEQGYSLGYIGKLHTDFPTPNLPGGKYATTPQAGGKVWDAYTPPGPKRHSFDFWYSYGTYDEHFEPHYWDTEGNYHEVKEWSPDHEAGIAVSYIRNEKGQRDPKAPFGLWVSLNPPHHPYQYVLEKDLAQYDGLDWEDLAVRLNIDKDNEVMREHIKNHFAMITGVDRVVGEILKAVEEAGVAENTIVVLTSDHGEHMGSQNLTAKNYPYAESMDVPFLIRFPGRIKPHTDDLLMGTCDIMPTLLGLAGLESTIPDDLDGANHAGLLLDASSTGERPQSACFFRNVNGPADKNGKVHDFVTDFIGVKTLSYSFWISRESKGWDPIGLYDNVKDPYQLTNLAGTEPELAKQMMETLKASLPERLPLDKLHPEVAALLNAE